jgi:uncharacterized protein (TIGR02271 family)
MNQTVVGVFDSYEAAERAAAELARLGFERSEMQIQAAEERSRTATSGDDASPSSDRADEGTGVMASIRHFFAELFGDDDDHAGNYAEAVRRGSAVLTVATDDTRLDVARQALTNAGAVDIDEQVSAWRSEGWTGHDSSAAPVLAREQSTSGREQMSSAREQTANRQGEREDVLPVLREELEIGKRQVSGGAARVVSRVVSRPVSESVELRREEAVVERRPVDREASGDDLGAVQERTVEVQEMAERPVVQKTARVVEEVVVGKRVSSETQVVEDTVRSTEVDVERVGDRQGERGERTQGALAGAVAGASTTARRSFADLEDEFRQDYRTNYASSGGTYEDYQPAYRGGYELRSDSRYADRDWNDVEPEIRQRWEADHPDSAWERVKAAVRRAMESASC